MKIIKIDGGKEVRSVRRYLVLIRRREVPHAGRPITEVRIVTMRRVVGRVDGGVHGVEERARGVAVRPESTELALSVEGEGSRSESTERNSTFAEKPPEVEDPEGLSDHELTASSCSPDWNSDRW